MTKIVLANHAKLRFIERDIDVHQAKKIVKNCPVVKKFPDGTMVAKGQTDGGKTLEVVYFKEKSQIIIKTTYYAS